MATPAPTDITQPISPTRFAAALKDLSLASLHLKVLEIRNALLHLAHSNAQLRPFADGTETSLNLAPGQPDPDCADAIRENELVIARMHERIDLVQAEVVARGVSWREFEEEDVVAVDTAAVGGRREVEDDEPGVRGRSESAQQHAQETGSRPLTNGVHATQAEQEEEQAAASNAASRSSGTRGNPWTDGTFQVGTIRNGELHMDSDPPQRNGVGANNNTTAIASTATTRTQTGATSGGGRLTDEELRRLLEVRLAEEEDAEEDGGLHL